LRFYQTVFIGKSQTDFFDLKQKRFQAALWNEAGVACSRKGGTFDGSMDDESPFYGPGILPKRSGRTPGGGKTKNACK